MAASAFQVASTAISTAATVMASSQQASAYTASAKVENELAQYRAKQLEQNAGQERAASQHRAEQARKQARLVQSRARAVGAAGGAVKGTDIEDILAGLEAEGDYNVKSALYEGEEAARGMEAQAEAERYGGAIGKKMAAYQAGATRRAGYMSAAGNIMQGAASMYDKYWPTDDSSTSGSLTMNASGSKFGKYSSQVAYG
jgi:hypothetical protein